ncbi:MAG: TIGR03936 family radical SAM-associated protein [Oscillospiraceae bacterium]|nr:TIGR03936 family radical SAM-associated protein [Oscillospiraceae bacterium]
MDKLRLRFEKTGRAIYISHLDLMATMQRGFSRAGLRLQYSEGFNPHPLISILLPLSVGTASICELMDFRLREETDLQALSERLTAALPEGIRVREVWPCERKSAELKWLDVCGRLEYDRGLPSPEELTAFFSRPEIVIEKKTKRGLGITDIRPAIDRISLCAEDGCIRLDARISAQEPTLNPELLPAALRQLQPELAPDFAAFTRLETYDRDHQIYR